MWAPERICHSDVGARLRESRPQPLQDPYFAGIERHEMECMNGPVLADPIDATNPLFEPHGVPRQLEVDHHATATLKIQPFTCRVGGKEDRPATAGKIVERGAALPARQAAMENGACPRESLLKMEKRVPVLGEDDCRFAKAFQTSEEADERSDFGFSDCRGAGRVSESKEESALEPDVGEQRRVDEGRFVG